MCPYRAAALAFTLPALACQSLPTTDEARWLVDVQPVVRIEWDSDIDGYDLHDVRAAIRLADGRIAVVDGGSAEVRWFDPDGAFVGRLGGDDVFHRIQDAVRGRGDTIVVRTMDPAIVRVDGQTSAVVDRVALPPALPAGPCESASGTVSPDGSLLVRIGAVYGRSCPPYPEGLRRTSVTLARYHPVTGSLDTLGVMPGRERSASHSLAFPLDLVVGQSADRLFAAETAGDSIVAMGYDGAPLGVQHSGLERVPVEQDVIDRAAARRNPPEVPSKYPRFASLFPDREANLWVMAYPRQEDGWGSWRPDWVVGNGADWAVLDPAGRRIARVRTPPGLQVLEIGGDYVIGVIRDGNLESVRMYTLRKQT